MLAKYIYLVPKQKICSTSLVQIYSLKISLKLVKKSV